MGVPLCQVSRDQLDEGQDCLLVISNASNSPSYPRMRCPGHLSLRPPSAVSRLQVLGRVIAGWGMVLRHCF